MKKKFVVGLLTVLFMICFIGTAGATISIYDNFDNGTIDSSKWIINDNTGLFTAGGGTLNFSSSGADISGSIRSQIQFPDITMAWTQFSNFYSSNSSPSGQGLGSPLAFRLWENSTNYVEIERGQVNGGGFFQFDYVNNGVTTGKIVTGASALSGMLGFSITGSSVQAIYNLGMDPNVGWQNLGSPIDIQGWTVPPSLQIYGKNGPTGTTSFSVDNVSTVSPVPLPGALLLFGPGLAGLVALRRRFTK